MTLPRDFYLRPVLDVAPDLLGSVVQRQSADGLVCLRITEVEAYSGADDPGSHAFRGATARNATMFGPPGHLYVYFTYGMHYCMNVVCGPPGQAAAVLLRAGEVVAGIELARARRPGVLDRDLARGPARLTKALAVDRVFDGMDVVDPCAPLRVVAGDPVASVEVSARTGVAGAGSGSPWRFAAAGEPSVSPYRPAVARHRLRDSTSG